MCDHFVLRFNSNFSTCVVQHGPLLRGRKEVLALLAFYAAYIDSSLPTVRGIQCFLSSKIEQFLDDTTDGLSRNFGKQLPT